MEIVVKNPIQSNNVIAIEQYFKKRQQRRRRVAKRQLKRFPLFAVEFMSIEFPNYDYDTFVLDVTQKKRKRVSFKKVKSPMRLQGRYPLYEKALFSYQETKDIRYLVKAQMIRDRLFKPYKIQVRIGQELENWNFPSTVGYKFIEDLVKQINIHGRFENQQDADDFYKEHTKYAYCS
jgi:hypothetical protein